MYSSVDIVLSANDADGDEILYSLVTAPTQGQITQNGSLVSEGQSLNGTSVTYHHFAGDYNPDSFVFSADDYRGGYDEATISITVAGVDSDD